MERVKWLKNEAKTKGTVRGGSNFVGGDSIVGVAPILFGWTQNLCGGAPNLCRGASNLSKGAPNPCGGVHALCRKAPFMCIVHRNEASFPTEQELNLPTWE